MQFRVHGLTRCALFVIQMLPQQNQIISNSNQPDSEVDFSLIELLPNGRVDARNLQIFLESSQQFADWMKSLIENYDFQEGFEVFHKNVKNPNGGRPRTEYELSISCAKEICMVSRSEKGKQARKYFIAMEEKAKEIKSLSPAEILMQQAKFMLETEKQLQDQEKRLSKIESRQQEAQLSLQTLDLTTSVELKEKSTRSKISELMRSYVEVNCLDYRQTWRKLYSDCYYSYHLDLRQRAKLRTLKEGRKVSPMDIAEELGMLEQLWTLAVHLCTEK